MDGTVDAELEDVASVRAPLLAPWKRPEQPGKNHLVGALKIVGNLKKVPES